MLRVRIKSPGKQPTSNSKSRSSSTANSHPGQPTISSSPRRVVLPSRSLSLDRHQAAPAQPRTEIEIEHYQDQEEIEYFNQRDAGQPRQSSSVQDRLEEPEENPMEPNYEDEENSQPKPRAEETEEDEEVQSWQNADAPEPYNGSDEFTGDEENYSHEENFAPNNAEDVEEVEINFPGNSRQPRVTVKQAGNRNSSARQRPHEDSSELLQIEDLQESNETRKFRGAAQNRTNRPSLAASHSQPYIPKTANNSSSNMFRSTHGETTYALKPFRQENSEEPIESLHTQQTRPSFNRPSSNPLSAQKSARGPRNNAATRPQEFSYPSAISSARPSSNQFPAQPRPTAASIPSSRAVRPQPAAATRRPQRSEESSDRVESSYSSNSHLSQPASRQNPPTQQTRNPPAPTVRPANPPVAPVSSSERVLQDRILELESDLFHHEFPNVPQVKTPGKKSSNARPADSPQESSNLLSAGASALHALESELESNYLELAHLQDELLKLRTQYSHCQSNFLTLQNEFSSQNHSYQSLQREFQLLQENSHHQGKQLQEWQRKAEQMEKEFTLEKEKTQQILLKAKQDFLQEKTHWKIQKNEMETRFTLLLESSQNQSNDEYSRLQERLRDEEKRFAQKIQENEDFYHQQFQEMKNTQKKEISEEIERIHQQWHRKMQDGKEEKEKQWTIMQEQLEAREIQWNEEKSQWERKEFEWQREISHWKEKFQQAEENSHAQQREWEDRVENAEKAQKQEIAGLQQTVASLERSLQREIEKTQESQHLYEEIVKSHEKQQSEKGNFLLETRKSWEFRLEEEKIRWEKQFQKELAAWERKYEEKQGEIEEKQKKWQEQGEIHQKQQKEQEIHLERLLKVLDDQRESSGKEIRQLKEILQQGKNEEIQQNQLFQLEIHQAREENHILQQNYQELQGNYQRLQEKMQENEELQENQWKARAKELEMENFVMKKRQEEWAEELKIARDKAIGKFPSGNYENSSDPSGLEIPSTPLERAYHELSDQYRLREKEREIRLKQEKQFEWKFSLYQNSQQLYEKYEESQRKLSHLEGKYSLLENQYQEQENQLKEFSLTKATLNGLKRQLNHFQGQEKEILQGKERIQQLETLWKQESSQRQALEQWKSQGQQENQSLLGNFQQSQWNLQEITHKYEELKEIYENSLLKGEKQLEMMKSSWKQEKIHHSSIEKQLEGLEKQWKIKEIQWKGKISQQREEIQRYQELEASWRIYEEKWRKSLKDMEENERRWQEKERDWKRLKAIQIENATKKKISEKANIPQQAITKGPNRNATITATTGRIPAGKATANTTIRAGNGKSTGRRRSLSSSRVRISSLSPSPIRIGSRSMLSSSWVSDKQASPQAPGQQPSESPDRPPPVEFGTLDNENFQALQRLQQQIQQLNQLQHSQLAAQQQLAQSSAESSESQPIRHELSILTQMATPGGMKKQ